MTTRTDGACAGQAGTAAPDIKRLWKDTRREEQKARIGALNLQCCLAAGQKAWEQARLAHNDLPPGVRIDLPSPKVFARVLGLLRCVAALKFRPMDELELSAQDIADAIGYSKATVEAALRWLGDDVIEHQGKPVARGLGFIRRVRRKAMAIVGGVYKRVYRTTEMALTVVGRMLVGLVELAQRKDRQSKVPRPEGSRERKRERKRPSPLHPPSEPNGRAPRELSADDRQIGAVWLQRLTKGNFSPF